MLTLVFSDTHLSKKFDKKLFNALSELISRADKVIINGDFWEGLAINFEGFLESDWKQLFPLLKQKDTVYIYGNHDHQIYCDDRVYVFCNKAVTQYELRTPKHNYLFRHGHEFLFPKHSNKYLRKNTNQSDAKMRESKLKLSTFIQKIGFGLFGPKFLPACVNRLSPQERSLISKPDQILVCGHTHRPHYDKKSNFLDTGFFNFGWANYMEIDETGDFRLISRRY